MSTNLPPGPELLTEGSAAEYICMSVAFLRAGRSRGVVGGATPAPPHFKLGNAVRYSHADLDAWLAARRIPQTRMSA